MTALVKPLSLSLPSAMDANPAAPAARHRFTSSVVTTQPIPVRLEDEDRLACCARTLLFLAVCAVFPRVSSAPCDQAQLVRFAVVPWALGGLLFLAWWLLAMLAGDRRDAAQFAVRTLAPCALHTAGIAMLVRAWPDAAWPCAAHGLLRSTPAALLLLTIAACTVCPHAHESSMVLAMLWPDLMGQAHRLAYALWLGLSL